MTPSALAPRLHFLVCANRRDPGSSLGPGCGEAGQRVFACLKDEVAQRGAYRAVWVTETKCLGLCPRRGAAVALYPRGGLFTEVEEEDARGLFLRAMNTLGDAP